MNKAKRASLAGKSRAFKAALKAVERLGAATARRGAKPKKATAKKAKPGPRPHG